MPGDEEIAKRLRQLNVPVVLAINKTDDKQARARVSEFHQLGFSPVVEVSAEHGDGVYELLDAMMAAAPRHTFGARAGHRRDLGCHRRPAERRQVVAGQSPGPRRSA